MGLCLPSPEVESGIDAKGTERVGYRKIRFPVVVGVHHKRRTGKILAVVIDYGSTGNQVEVDVLDPMLVLEIVVVNLRFLVSDTRKQGKIGHPVLGKDPIVSVSEA